MGISVKESAASARDGGWRTTGHAVAFWIFAIVGVPVMIGAWLLLPLASLEEATEQGKAVAAGTSMAGTTLMLGVLPLILAHIMGLALLCTIGGRGRLRRRQGVLLGATMVLVASAIGLAITWALSGGELIYSYEYVP